MKLDDIIEKYSNPYFRNRQLRAVVERFGYQALEVLGGKQNE